MQKLALAQPTPSSLSIGVPLVSASRRCSSFHASINV
jgi:hypothetical protein